MPTVVGKQRMKTADEFENILVKVNRDGSQIRLKDIAQVGLGSESFATSAKYNGKAAAGIGLRLAPGANLLDTMSAVRSTVAALEPYMPAGMKVVYPYDTSPVVKASIEAVVHTLLEAIVLVVVVMFLFLQNIRATLIPTLAVPVVLLGTFGVLFACGFTINVLTMFAMVLAIGLLVDDAIVVVENVERVMAEEGLSPKEATRKSMGQIQGALVGIAMVISAVFMPMAFFPGSAGVIYRQFSITIITAMGLSVLMALIFTPALCATLLKPAKPGHTHEKRGFFGWFNRTFDATAGRYQKGVAGILRRRIASIAVYAVIVAGVAFLFGRLPSTFLPNEDQGVIFVEAQLPPNATAERTEAVLTEVRNYLLQQEGSSVASAYTVNGFNFASRGQNSALVFVNLKPFEERPSQEQSAFAVAQRAAGPFCPDQGCQGHRVRAAGHARAGQRHGLRYLPPGPCRAWTRGPDAGARPVPAARQPGSDAQPRATERQVG